MSTTGKLLHIGRGHPLLSHIIRMDQDFFPNPWTPEAWNEINYDHHLLLASQENEQVQAFALLKVTSFDETAHLLKILVHPERRGKELTQELWASVASELVKLNQSTIYLEVGATNLRAIGFYKKVGFTPLRKVKGFYSDGSDAIIMQLTLRDERV